MQVIPNKKLSHIPVVVMDIDNTSDLPYKVAKPLPAKSFAMLIIGQPSSGKTTLWNSLLLAHPTKKKPHIDRAYYRYFDHVWLISPSLMTLPLHKLNLNDGRIFDSYSDELMEGILDEEKNGDNLNNLIVLDDSVRDLTKSKILCKTILNRRHCTHDPEKDGNAGLSIIITSQKYNMVPMALRLNMSQVIVFRTENQKELSTIRDELLGDLTKKEQDELLKTAWNDKHDFLYIDSFKPKKERYYRNFDRIEIPD